MGVVATPGADPLGVVHVAELEQAVGPSLTWARLWKEEELGKASGAWYLLTSWLSLHSADSESAADLPQRREEAWRPAGSHMVTEMSGSDQVFH